MAAPLPNSLLDLVELANKGFHSGVDAKLLPPDQHEFGVNVTCRGGKIKSRPPIRKMATVFGEEVQAPATVGRFQGAEFYEALSGPNSLIVSVSGRIFQWRINNDTASVSELALTTGNMNNPNLPIAWMFQGEEFMVINDGQSLPLFFDGAGIRRSGGQPAQELPVGCMGHYCNGRISMVLPNDAYQPGQSFIAGDLVGSLVSGTLAYGYRDSILKTTENLTILGGAAFAIPLTSGKITSMFSVAIPDTSLGQGPLQIGTRKGVFSVNLPLDATQWTTTQQPNSVVSLPSYGPTGQSSVAVVNGDAWYRGKDGIRSYSVARRDYNTWVQTALSAELDAILPFDTQNLLEYASAVCFDNRLIMTCSPYTVIDRGVAHRGLVALDFDNVSSITSRSQPDYDALWTGLNILKVVEGEFNGVERCFLFALDEENVICLYELLPTITTQNFDWNGEEEVPAESWFISNAITGKESIDDPRRIPLKKLITADLFFSELAGNVEFVVQYKSDQWPFWVDWHTFSICAPATYCPPDCNTPFEEVQRQYATYKRLPEPNDDCNSLTGRQFRTGYFFQVRVQWTGRAKLDRMLIWTTPIKENLSSCP